MDLVRALKESSSFSFREDKEPYRRPVLHSQFQRLILNDEVLRNLRLADLNLQESYIVVRWSVLRPQTVQEFTFSDLETLLCFCVADVESLLE